MSYRTSSFNGYSTKCPGDDFKHRIRWPKLPKPTQADRIENLNQRRLREWAEADAKDALEARQKR